MRRVSKRILSSVLTGAMLLSLISSSALAAEPITEPEESPQSNGMTYEDRDAIESIQATVVDSFYGYKVGSVEITYQPGTDLRDVENGTYTVWDRGFNNPEFGKLKITDTQVDDNVVTLIVDEGTDKVTDRTRETYGTLCTSSNWYIDNKGYVHYDGMEKDSIGKEILPNDINKGLQWRNLDLILTIDDQPVYDGIFSTDGVGNMLPDDMTVWEEPILPDGLDEVVLEMVDVGWEAEGYTQVNEQEGTEGRVPVQVIYPEGYDANRAEPYPTIVYQCGGGVCYWEDNGEYAANNLGCNVVYDVMMTEWHEQMPDAIVMSVNVHSTPIDNSATEIAGVLDYAIANWNVDKDRIIVVGNSQGTLISSDLIRQRPDLVAGFVECNGNLGAQGCASWAFDRKGVIVIDNEEGELDEDTVMMDALEAGAADFEADGPALEITCDPDAFNDVVKALEGKGYAFASAEIEMVPQNYITLTGEGDVKNMEKLIDMLEDNDDVQNVWHNWNQD